MNAIYTEIKKYGTVCIPNMIWGKVSRAKPVVLSLPKPYTIQDRWFSFLVTIGYHKTIANESRIYIYTKTNSTIEDDR